jgi:hypothetical protein
VLDPGLIEDFEFDMGNLPHLMKRHIEPTDVWEVYFSDPVFVEDETDGSGDWKEDGRTDSRRLPYNRADRIETS